MFRLFALSCVLIVVSNDHQFEKDFLFCQPRETRLARMRQCSLVDQYRVWADKIEPPARYLAAPIAEKGTAVVPFLTEQLKSDHDDLAVRDILFLFEEMQWMKTFDAREDASLMQILDTRVQAIKNKNVQYSSRVTLEQIKNAPELP
jgi:hypothetical protein